MMISAQKPCFSMIALWHLGALAATVVASRVGEVLIASEPGRSDSNLTAYS